MNERYSIEVNDEKVIIYGDLSIEETFDFLNFYEKKGYRTVSWGYENSTLLMLHKELSEALKTEEEKEAEKRKESSEGLYEKWYEDEKLEHVKTKSRVKELESLVKTICDDKSERIKNLQKENEHLSKKVSLHKLENDGLVKEILNELECELPEEESPL